MFLLATAVAAARVVWPTWAAAVVTVIGVALLLTGHARYRWLADGAPNPGAAEKSRWRWWGVM